MKILRNTLDKVEPLFSKGGKLEKLYPLWEANDSFLYTPGSVTRNASHVRDAADLKRIMITVVVALVPAILMAMYNTGLQTARAIAGGAQALDTWQTAAMQSLGMSLGDPANVLACFVHGALYFLPIMLTTYAIGGMAEVTFSLIRKHEVNEGFLVTGMLFPLTLPPTIPLWQVALGIIFGTVIGKEVFGGTGKNILNPALVGRAFLYFAYPAQISGDAVWTAVDGYSGATALGISAIEGVSGVVESGLTWTQAFLGQMQGSIGETSALACLIGGLILIYSGIASWRIIVGVFLGLLIPILLGGVVESSNPMINMPFHWHIVLGGFFFGAVFMATDPVSACQTNTGRWAYGLLIGFMTWLIRVINPAFPEGIMLAILFANVFAPTIDYFVVQSNIKRRLKRGG